MILFQFDYNTMISSGVLIYWMLAVGQLVVRSRDIDHNISSLFFFSIGLWILLHNTLTEWYFLICFQLSFIYIRAPLFYFYYRKIIDPDFKFSSAQIQHFLPGLVIFFFLVPMSSKYFIGQVSYQMVFNNPEFHVDAMILDLLIIIGYVLNLVYLFAILVYYRALFFMRHDEIRYSPHTRLILLQIVGIIVVAIIASVEEILHRPGLPISSIYATVYVLVFYLSIVRYPEYMRLVKQETQKIRYAQSRVRNLNFHRIFKEMRQLMDKEKIFTDESLSLAGFAKMLDVAPQQLSEILNHHMKTSFHDYINKYRIEEAKRILVTEPEAKVITVAFDVGFNTKSAFYTAFQKFTGQSPGAFRKATTKSIPSEIDHVENTE